MSLKQTPLKILRMTPEEELEYLKSLHGENYVKNVYALISESLNILQFRCQTVLGLISICLTITGFSGPQVAASSLFSKISISLGLAFSLLSALVLIYSLIRITWITNLKAENIEQTLLYLLWRRNRKTRQYHISLVFFFVGITGYVGSLVVYLMSLNHMR